VTFPSQAASAAGVFMMASNSTSAIDDGGIELSKL